MPPLSPTVATPAAAGRVSSPFPRRRLTLHKGLGKSRSRRLAAFMSGPTAGRSRLRLFYAPTTSELDAGAAEPEFLGPFLADRGCNPRMGSRLAFRLARDRSGDVALVCEEVAVP